MAVRRDRPRGFVIEQVPDPDDPVSLDCAFLSFFCDKPTVTLSVSAGPGSAVVPDVRGEDRSDAAAALRRRGFGVEVETAFSDTFAEDTVIRTDPAAGESARRGSAVTMLVSRGQRLVGGPLGPDVLVASDAGVAPVR